MGPSSRSLPGLVENIRYDLGYIRGSNDRDTYLRRFKGQKHDALENEELVRYLRATTNPADRIFVFGFSGGSVVLEERAHERLAILLEQARAHRVRRRSTRLRISRPAEDLHRNPPAVVALQNEEWRSRDFFMNNDPLRSWLQSGYRIDHQTPMFSVWRRKS